MMSVSVVMPTYNRVKIVGLSVQSALETLAGICNYEVIVVDDASTDDTLSYLLMTFAKEIASGHLKILENGVNRGVTGSKNAGYLAAQYDWAVFLDSDDTFIPGVGGSMISALAQHSEKPIIFFRCVDQTGIFVGQAFDQDVVLDLETYLEHTSFGEGLTVINKRFVKEVPYEECLRGYEGLGCSRIIARYGAGVLSKLAARQYDCTGTDRLSVSSGFLKRMPLLAKGHMMLVREFGSNMRWRRKAGYILKAAVYYFLGGAYRLSKGMKVK